MDEPQQLEPSQTIDIVQAFRQVYIHIMQNTTAALSENTDSTVLARISDEINEYQNLFLQVCRIIFRLTRLLKQIL